MVDERALEAALVAYLSSGGPEHVDMMRAAIEAYEAAKWRPTRWITIEEAPRDGSWVLIFRPYRDHPSSDGGTLDLGFYAADAKAWMLAGRQNPRSLDQMVHDGAQFQTIDPPPPQNAAQRAGDARQAAREDKSGAS